MALFFTSFSGLNATLSSRTSLSLARARHSRPRRSQGQWIGTLPGLAVMRALNCRSVPQPNRFCISAHFISAMPLIFIGHQTMPLG